MIVHDTKNVYVVDVLVRLHLTIEMLAEVYSRKSKKEESRFRELPPPMSKFDINPGYGPDSYETIGAV
jgi:hypothetical protein